MMYIDLIFFHQKGNSFTGLIDDILLTPDHLRHVYLKIAEPDTMFFKSLMSRVVVL